MKMVWRWPSRVKRKKCKKSLWRNHWWEQNCNWTDKSITGWAERLPELLDEWGSVIEDRTWSIGTWCFLFFLELLQLSHCFAPVGCSIDMGSCNPIEAHSESAWSLFFFFNLFLIGRNLLYNSVFSWSFKVKYHSVVKVKMKNLKGLPHLMLTYFILVRPVRLIYF